MLKKNDKVCIDITDYTDEGLGVGRARVGEGTLALFVKDTAIGDRIEAVVTRLCKTYGYGRLLSVLEPSPDRTDPQCSVSTTCGGCRLRHISYPAQLAWKEKRVSDCMERIGGLVPGKDFELLPIVGMDKPLRYRNKAQYPVCYRNGKTVTGFYAGRTHTVVESEDCLIEPESFGNILRVIREYADLNNISVYDEGTGKGLIRHVLLREGMGGEQLMVCIIVNALPGDKCLEVFEELAETLRKIPEIKTFILSHNTKLTNVILGRKETVLFGNGRIRDMIGDRLFEISAGSFYQVNPLQTAVLYEKTADAAQLKGQETVWDLYCGTGTISLFLAKNAGSVYGVELSESAVRDAIRNTALNGMDNVHFYCGKAEDTIIVRAGASKHNIDTHSLEGQDNHSFENNIRLPAPDVIVVDPPRKGCDQKLIATIINSGADRLVYVSCNPATMARDAKELACGGYRLEMLQPVDMFPHTTGVECVGRFCRIE